MNKQRAIAKAAKNHELWLILSLLLLIVSVLFVVNARAEEPQGQKTGICPRLQTTEKQMCPRASMTGMPGYHHAGKSGMCPMALKQKMNLTDQQFEEMKKIGSTYRKDTQELRDRIHEKQKEMEALYRDPEARDKDIEKINSELLEMKGQKGEKRMAYELKLRSVFTLEQLKSLPPGSMKGLLRCGDDKADHPCYKGDSKGMCPRSGKGMSEGTAL